MRGWVVCRRVDDVLVYRAKRHDPIEGWVSGIELQQVRTWDDREKAEDYATGLECLYPQLGNLTVVKVLIWTQAGIIGVMAE